jgi:sugar phosphate isomerase/epimerase
VALPWAVIRQVVGPHDIDGRTLRGELITCGLDLAVVELAPLTCLDTATIEREIDEAYMQMQIAERLGTPLAVLASAHEGPVGFAMMADAVTRLAALAERMAVRLLVRNGLGSAIEQAEDMHELLRRCGDAKLGVCLDNAAFGKAAVNPADMVLRFRGRLAAVRLGDADGDHLSATLDALTEEDYRGPLIIDADKAYAAEQAIRPHLKS